MTTYYSEPGIFNAIDPLVYVNGAYNGLIANDSSTFTAQQNTAVLRGLIALAQESCDQSLTYGATIVIPGHSIVPPPGGAGIERGSTYYFAKPDTEPAAIPIQCNWPLRFLGTGNTKLVMTGDNSGQFGDFFQVQTGGNVGGDPLGDNVGGITFEDLEIVYPQFVTQQYYRAIHVVPAGAQNFRLVRMVFSNCPIGVQLDNGLQSSMLQCTFQYTPNGNIGTQVILGDNTGDGAKQVYIAGCLFIADMAPKGSSAIVIYGVDHVNVSDCRIDSYLNGIQIIPGPGHNAVHCHFTGLDVYTGADDSNVLGHAVLIQPQSSGTQIAQITFTNCAFELGAQATPVSPGGPGILIDANGNMVDNVRFVSCYSARWPGPGLMVKNSVPATGGATNLEVLGGFYAGNEYESIAAQPYGIYVGAANGVRIIGASCLGEFEWIQFGGSSTSDQQAVGIYLDAGASSALIAGCDVRENGTAGIYVMQGTSDVIIDGCDVTGNGTAGGYGIVVNGSSGAVSGVFIRDCNAGGYSSYGDAINVMGSASNVSTVEITNCAGYNDQNVVLSSSPPVNNIAFFGYTYSYYGPVTFYVTAGTATISGISVAAHTTHLISGTFTLAPRQSGLVAWGLVGSPTFVMIGQ